MKSYSLQKRISWYSPIYFQIETRCIIKHIWRSAFLTDHNHRFLSSTKSLFMDHISISFSHVSRSINLASYGPSHSPSSKYITCGVTSSSHRPNVITHTNKKLVDTWFFVTIFVNFLYYSFQMFWKGDLIVFLLPLNVIFIAFKARLIWTPFMCHQRTQNIL